MGIYNSLPIVARALSSTLAVEITVGGDTAYAGVHDGKGIINIPFLNNADSLANAILGYTVHEAAHIRFTEFDTVFPEFDKILTETVPTIDINGNVKELPKYNRNVLHSLWNIAEDLRIERAIVRKFPGTIRYLQAVRELVFDGNIKPSNEPSVIYLDTMLLCGRERYHGFNTHSGIRREEFIQEFGQDLLDKSLDCLGESVLSTTTLDCLDVARRLYDLAIEAFNKKDSPEDEQSDSKDNSDADEPTQGNSPDDNSDSDEPTQGDSPDDNSDSDEPNQGNSPDDTANATQDDANSVQSSDDSSTGQSQSKPDSNIDGDGDGVSGSSSSNSDPFSDVTSEDVKRVAGDISDKFNEKMQGSIQQHNPNTFPLPKPFVMGDLSRYEGSSPSVQKGLRGSVGLRQSLNGLLQGQRRTRTINKDYGNNINGRVLPTILTGNTKVFKHKSKSVSLNSAVSVLLDRSGSMSRRITEAEAAVISLLNALDTAPGVTTGAFNFPAAQGTVGIMKRRDQNLKTAIANLQFGTFTDGSTPLESALWPVLAELANTKADQHILVIVTDGEPDEVSLSAQIIRDAKLDGIKVIGIGINVRKRVMQEVFESHYICIQDIGELRNSLFDVSRQILAVA